jgi:hypothetical protein
MLLSTIFNLFFIRCFTILRKTLLGRFSKEKCNTPLLPYGSSSMSS